LKILACIHDISSVQRLVDFVRTAYGLGAEMVIVSKVYGAAAVNGVPEATKIALKLKKGLIVVSNPRDVIEANIASKEHIIVLDPSDEACRVSCDELRKLIGNAEAVLMVFFGGDNVDPQVTNIGKRIYIKGINTKISPIAELALVTSCLKGTF